MSGPDYILDIAGLRGGAQGTQTPGGQGAVGRPWLAVHWRCCSVYSRVYRNRDATAYEGGCPACGKPLRVKIGAGGTSSRFFEAH